MKKTLKVIKSSDLYNKIDALELTPSERQEAVGALGAADRLVDVLAAGWVWLGHFGGGTAGNPKLKHQ
jgi:hypothetical protein